MANAINIQSIPISIELKSSRATYQQKTTLPTVNVTRNRGRMTITTDPIRLKLDTLDTRRSMHMETPLDSVASYADEGIRLAYNATARYAEEGNMLASGGTIPDVVMSRMEKSIDTMLEFIPSVAPNISWDGGTLNIAYQADQLDFDWKLKAPELEFVPGKIELTIKDYPRVIIEYVGDPIYVPASANPNKKDK